MLFYFQCLPYIVIGYVEKRRVTVKVCWDVVIHNVSVDVQTGG